MGRRAKNKQGAPDPLEPKVWTTPKKSGKRKAAADVDVDGKTSARPAKKIKDSDGNVKPKPSTKPKSSGKGKNAVKDLSDGDDSGDGWEDVESEGGLDSDSLVGDGEYVDASFCFPSSTELFLNSDDMLRGPVQEFDFGSDDEEPEPLPSKHKKSKQSERPLKIIPTGSDDSSSSDDEEDDEPITMANMEARSRALDAKTAAEAELDLEELQEAAVSDEDDDDVDMDGEADADGEMNAEPFHLPTAAERDEEKKTGGPDLHIVQRRMRECVRVLGKFKRLAAEGR